jgi:speckle-type POZ protein
MFEYETKENLTNQIEIEDVEPEVFQELLRFIYTGEVFLNKMETIAAGLLIAADKYLLDGLKMICENYLLRYISPENCVVLLLNGDLENPTERLKEAAKYFLRYPTQVMATANWETTKEENPTLLCDIQEFVFSCK